MAYERVLDLGQRNRPASCPFNGGHAPLREATWHDQAEMFQIRRHVEGKPVARNPPGDTNPYRSNLIGINPRSRESLYPAGDNSVIAADADHHFLDIAHVTMDVLPIGPQVDDRITDDLSGAVIGHVAAPTGLVDLDPELGEPGRRGNDVRARVVSLDAERDHRGMLEQQQDVRR